MIGWGSVSGTTTVSDPAWANISGSATVACQIWAKAATSADTPGATYTFTNGGLSASAGVIINYTANVPSAGGANAGTASPAAAPAIPIFGAMRVIEAWLNEVNTNLWSITSNVNSPATRASFGGNTLSLLVVDFATLPGTSSMTGDTATATGAVLASEATAGLF